MQLANGSFSLFVMDVILTYSYVRPSFGGSFLCSCWCAHVSIFGEQLSIGDVGYLKLIFGVTDFGWVIVQCIFLKVIADNM